MSMRICWAVCRDDEEGRGMLIGIVVKNGIVLIDYITLNRERGLSITKAVLNAGKSRMRPVL